MDARSTAEDSEEVLEAAQLSSADQAIPATTRCGRPAVKLGSVIHSSDEGTGRGTRPDYLVNRVPQKLRDHRRKNFSKIEK